jgi:hypothetical protein
MAEEVDRELIVARHAALWIDAAEVHGATSFGHGRMGLRAGFPVKDVSGGLAEALRASQSAVGRLEALRPEDRVRAS